MINMKKHTTIVTDTYSGRLLLTLHSTKNLDTHHQAVAYAIKNYIGVLTRKTITQTNWTKILVLAATTTALALIASAISWHVAT